MNVSYRAASSWRRSLRRVSAHRVAPEYHRQLRRFFFCIGTQEPTPGTWPALGRMAEKIS
jgi:hypothetical protein